MIVNQWRLKAKGVTVRILFLYFQFAQEIEYPRWKVTDLINLSIPYTVYYECDVVIKSSYRDCYFPNNLQSF